MDSQVQGPPLDPPPVGTIAEALVAAAREDGPWATFHRGATQRTLSFAEALQLALGTAAALRAAGVKPGDRVAVIQPNDAGFVGAFFGAHLAGATPVPLPWPVVAAANLRTYASLGQMVTSAAAAAVAAPADFEAARGFGLPVVSAPLDGAFEPSMPAPADLAFLQFTSGSTGAPRGAMIRHSAAVASAWAMGRALRLTRADVGVSWLPLFHDMGLVGVLLCSLLYRFPVHLLAPAEFLLRPRRWLEVLSAARGTLTVAPNFGYELAVRRGGKPEGLDLSALKQALSGSEPVHRATIERFEGQFAPAGLKRGTVLPVYGLAENTLGVTFADVAAPAPDLALDDRLVPAVGRPIPGMEVAIGREDGTAAPEGTAGEICVRGPALMSGYFRQPEASEAALRGGWLRTGDLGVLRGGILHITGREKDLVIKNGRKFHPYDIERVVAEAIDAPPGGVAAFAVNNEATGSEDLVVVAELRRKGGEEQAVRTIRGRLLEELDVRPERVRLVGAGALPRTSSGKLRRRAAAEQFGGPEA